MAEVGQAKAEWGAGATKQRQSMLHTHRSYRAASTSAAFAPPHTDQRAVMGARYEPCEPPAHRRALRSTTHIA